MIHTGLERQKPGFKDWAAIRKLHDGTGRFELVKPLIFTDEDGKRWIVPKGFKTDLASIPRILWPVFAPIDSYLSASVLHDHLYTIKQVSRKTADLLFLQAMKYSNVPLWKRQIIYRAVRLFGGGHWG